MMNNGPKLWNKLLAEAPTKEPVLMGGAVIDYEFGYKVNDYDIFFSYIPAILFNLPPNWKMTDADFNDPVWLAEHEAHYLQGIEGNGDHPISSVHEYLVDGEYKVQLIGVKYADPAEHFKNFDHSLTLGRYTKNGMFVHRKAFDSVENQVVEYVSNNHSIAAVTRSINRVYKKLDRWGLGHGPWDLKNFTVNEALPVHAPAQPAWGGLEN